MIYILGIQSRRREVDAEFRTLSGLTPLTHHDLFTWASDPLHAIGIPDIVEDLDGFIKADPEDRYSRLAVVELLLERPERESYIAAILEPLPDYGPGRAGACASIWRSTWADSTRPKRLLASAPDGHPRISRIRGELALRRHDLDGAIRHFREALSAEPYDRVSPMQLAQALRLKGDAAAAEVLCRTGPATQSGLQPDRPRPLSRAREPGLRPHRAGQGLRGRRSASTRPAAGTAVPSPRIRSKRRLSKDCVAWNDRPTG